MTFLSDSPIVQSILFDAYGEAIGTTTVDGATRALQVDVAQAVPVNQGTAASGSGAWPVKVTDNSGNTIGTLFKTLYSDPNGDRRTVHSGSTITSNDSTVLTWVGHSEWYLVINLKDAPTGTDPTIKFTIEQLDPIDQTTVISDARVYDGYTFTSAGSGLLDVPELETDTLKISWTVTGAGASWTNVNVSFCGHGAGNAIEGQAEVGTVAADPPVGVAGVDNNGAIQYLRVDSEGRLAVVAASSSSIINGFSNGRVVLSTTTASAVRETTYTEPSSNAQRSVSSSSASDTSAGTGARTVRITYYTSGFIGPNTTDVTLSGTTPVNTSVSDICYIEKIEVLTVGSGLVNAGTISLFASTGGGGGTVWSIAIGSNQTFGAHHYVATGRTCFVTGIMVGIKGADTTSGFLRAINLSSANSADTQVSDNIRAPTSSQSFRAYSTPISVPAGYRITGMVAGDSSSSRTYYLSFDFYEE